MALLVAGASWFTNHKLFTLRLENAINRFKSEMDAKVKKDFKKLSNDLETAIENKDREVDKTIDKRLTLFEAEKARIFALFQNSRGDFKTESLWWALAITNYSKVNQDALLRICIQRLLGSLNRITSLEPDHVRAIEDCIEHIPRILNTEITQIRSRLTSLSSQT